MRTNLRIVDQFRNVGGEWYATGAPEKVENQISRARKELAIYQNEEPDSGWKLQTRGEVSDWHDWVIE